MLDSLINSERYVSGQLSELGGDTCGFRFQILNNNPEKGLVFTLLYGEQDNASRANASLASALLGLGFALM